MVLSTTAHLLACNLRSMFFHRVFQLSNDQKYGTVATTTPEVEHISWSEALRPKLLHVSVSLQVV